MTGGHQGSDDVVTELVNGHPVRCLRDRPRSIVEVLSGALKLFRDDVLVVDPALGCTVTYGEFAELVEGAAARLMAAGLVRGDRVAVLARNGLEAAVAIWACARAGLIQIGLPPDAPRARLVGLLHLVEARLVLAQPDLAERLAGPVPVHDAAEILLGTRLAWRTQTALPDQDTTYMLIPTSGTTGQPKAVRVTGRMAGHAAAFYLRALGLVASDRTAIHLPFGWVSGHITQLTPAMLSGGSAVTLARYSPAALVASAVQHGVTWLDVVPSVWEGLLRCEGFGLPGLAGVRLAVFGGAPASAGTLDRVRERLPNLALHDVYALSETCAPVTHLPDSDASRGAGSVGRAVPYVALKIVDPHGIDVASGDVGEVWVRSAVVTPGYWGNERPTIDPEGWLRTGDLGHLDPEGYLHLAGRAVDLIIRGGVNIYPEEVERALMGSGQLADAAAFGLPSAVSGHNVAAAVVALPGTLVDLTHLRRCVRDSLGAHAIPRPLRVVEALPRNPNGKVDRAALVKGWAR